MRINDPNLLQQVVNYLDKHQEAVRIKKMLYCLCTGRWEKDNDYLNSINFQYLIEQLVRENNTLDRFRLLLQKLVKTVNKPKQYIDIAKVIYLAIGQLYPEFRQEHGGKTPAPAPAARIPHPESTDSSISQAVPSAFQRAYAPQPTQLSSLDVPSSIARAYNPAPTQAFTNQVVPSALERAYAPQPTQQFDTQTPAYDEVDESAYETYYDAELGEDQFGSAESIPETLVPEYDPFVLRQNVMSYSNPLRAKIILLVMLRPNFNFSSQSAATMREYLLDELLLEVLKTYPTMPQLEESMTFAVEQLVEIEEYGKAATGLLQSLAPIYTIKTQAAR
ncbi:hypothetical protein [Chamaesiphon sp. VAR_48_metabat_135_sub]|uniref:hypothetical protein n=1 Tax=Chamaesiphon sp. VAR_48_metabat_135_sub TaxID=2964699 RepID=UPI00286BF2C1|nr:hypothetical protein [Chamaesiphon sp. VAR_48_metabat_135_sub]